MFAADRDPWQTFSSHDEALKRRSITHALVPGCRGRIYEMGSGNGSNSAALAYRCLRLDAVEGTREGVALTADAIAAQMRANAYQLTLPGRAPCSRYDAIVIAELLYYLTPIQMHAVAAECDRVVRPGTRLVLAHHKIDFHDFAQRASSIHDRFLEQTCRFGPLQLQRRTARWIVQWATAS